MPRALSHSDKKMDRPAFLKDSSLWLAPMSGFTDSAFRAMARGCGADVCVSEFAHSRAVLSGAAKVLERLKFEQCERPYGVQLFGSDPAEVADAAAFVEERISPDFIDINYGCPAPNAVCAGAGSALLKDPNRMARIASAAAAALKRIPLTAKMRTGWGAETVLPRAAKMLEDAGVAVLAIHGRSKVQGYSGGADWGIIEATAEALSIPVIGNGSAELLEPERLRSSACSGFMVGRAACGNPWVFSRMRADMCGGAFQEPSARDRVGAAAYYLDRASGGDDNFNIIGIRPNITAFLRGFPGFKRARLALAGARTAGEAGKILKEVLAV